MTISIDIVVPHYKDINDLRTMLNSLTKCELPQSLHRIFIIENGPLSGAKRLCEQNNHLPLVYLYAEQPGLVNARNIGIQNSSADFIIFFDNDLSFNKETIVAYEKAFVTFGQNYFYGGPVTSTFEIEPAPWVLNYVPPSVKGFNLGSENKTLTESIFLGGNHALSRAAITASFNKYQSVYEGESATEGGGGVGEEHRLQSRLLDMDFKACYVALANVYHPVPKTCISHQWICQRRFRRGFTEGSKINAGHSKIKIKQVPFWVWQSFISNLILERFFWYLNKELSIKYGVQRAWARGVIDAAQKHLSKGC